MSATRDALLAGGAPRLGIFVRLMVDNPMRIWLGIGDCKAGIDAADGDGEIYTGIGELLNVPTLEQVLNGAATRAEFRLSYIPSRVARLASSEAAQVKGRMLQVGLGVFDADWQLVEEPTWLRSYYVDYLTIEREQTSGEATWSVSLATRTIFTGRRRPGMSFWTDDDQQARHDGDRFCEAALLYSIDVSKAWPKL